MPARTVLGRLRNRALNRVLRHVVFADSQRAAQRIRAGLGLTPLAGYFLDWGPCIAHRYLHATIRAFEYPRRELPERVEFIGALLPEAVDAWNLTATPPADYATVTHDTTPPAPPEMPSSQPGYRNRRLCLDGREGRSA